MEMIKRFEPFALLVMMVGALNWGIVGITDGDTNVLHDVFGSGTLLNVIDVSAGVQRIVATAGVAEAQATAFVRGSTAAITTMEFEPGGVHDLQAMVERLIPAERDYEHNRLNHDTNSHAHQRASLVGSS